MICSACAAGADVKTVAEWDLKQLDEIGLSVAKNMHGLCKGGTWCDCQHRGTDHFRKPVGATI